MMAITTDTIFTFENIDEKEQLFNLLNSKEQTHGTQLISFFFKRIRPDHNAKLRKELSEAKNIKNKETQKTVSTGISTLLDVLTSLSEKPYNYKGPGVIFVKGDFYAVVKLPDHYNLELYYCGKSFRTDLLTETIGKAWGLIVLDTREVSIGVFSNNVVTTLSNFDVFVPHKMKAGGQSAARFEETRKNKVYELMQKVSTSANELFSKYDVDRILLGGIIPTSTTFYVYNTLKAEYKAMLQEPTPTCYTSPEGLEQLINRNKEAYEEQLRQYLLEKDEYHSLVRNEQNDVHPKNAILKTLVRKPQKIWAIAGSVNLGHYCSTCRIIYYSDKDCEHPKINLKEDPTMPKYYFSGNSPFGKILKKQSDIYYKVKIEE